MSSGLAPLRLVTRHGTRLLLARSLDRLVRGPALGCASEPMLRLFLARWRTRLVDGRRRAASDRVDCRKRAARAVQNRIPVALLAAAWQRGGTVLEAGAELPKPLQMNSETGELPRVIGMHEFEMGGKKGKRGVFTWDIFMLQRVTDLLVDAPPEVTSFIGSLGEGGSQLLSLAPVLSGKGAGEGACRVERLPHKIGQRFRGSTVGFVGMVGLGKAARL